MAHILDRVRPANALATHGPRKVSAWTVRTAPAKVYLKST